METIFCGEAQPPYIALPCRMDELRGIVLTALYVTYSQGGKVTMEKRLTTQLSRMSLSLFA